MVSEGPESRAELRSRDSKKPRRVSGHRFNEREIHVRDLTLCALNYRFS